MYLASKTYSAMHRVLASLQRSHSGTCTSNVFSFGAVERKPLSDFNLSERCPCIVDGIRPRKQPCRTTFFRCIRRAEIGRVSLSTLLLGDTRTFLRQSAPSADLEQFGVEATSLCRKSVLVSKLKSMLSLLVSRGLDILPGCEIPSPPAGMCAARTPVIDTVASSWDREAANACGTIELFRGATSVLRCHRHMAHARLGSAGSSINL